MIVLRIECCHCGRFGAQRWGSPLAAHPLRTELKAEGWLVGARGGVDLCPNCRAKPGLADDIARERETGAASYNLDMEQRAMTTQNSATTARMPGCAR
jgi:hypothetical protein